MARLRPDTTHVVFGMCLNPETKSHKIVENEHFHKLFLLLVGNMLILKNMFYYYIPMRVFPHTVQSEWITPRNARVVLTQIIPGEFEPQIRMQNIGITLILFNILICCMF